MPLHVLPAIAHVSLVLSLRLLPFAVYATLQRTTWARRGVFVLAYATFPVLASCLGRAMLILFVGVGALYYVALSLAVNRLSALMSTGRVTRGGALGLLFVAFLLLPGVALPALAPAAFLIVGWELTLRAFSYCVETSRRGAATAPLRDCLFFLLVNPTLVYTARGSVRRATGYGGYLRAGAGAAVLLFDSAFLRPAAAYLRTGDIWSRFAWGTTAAWLLFGAMQFLALYAAHSGLASVQVGLMRQAGWVVPECYSYPILARSPMDFWRRWNTWVRVWLEAYVFLPVGRRVARTTRRRAGLWVVALATLGASGLIHDAYVLAGRQTVSAFATVFFVGMGALLALWRGAGLAGQVIRIRLSDRARRRFDLVGGLCSHVGMAGVMICATLASQGLQ